MKISSLYVRNYRNYTSAFVEFGDGLNVLEGPNASGKTNILEAVYLLGVGKSARTSQEKELVRIGEEKAYVKAVIQKKFRRHTIEMQIEQGGKKILIDGIPALRAAQLVGILNVVLFSPDEMKIVKESPAERRKFMDIGISQQSGQYFRTLVRYNKILKQKNKLLKEDVKNPDIDGMLEENESFRKVMEDGIVTEDEIKALSDNVVSVLHDIEARFSDEQQAEVRSLMVEACALFAAWHYHSVQSLNNE